MRQDPLPLLHHKPACFPGVHDLIARLPARTGKQAPPSRAWLRLQGRQADNADDKWFVMLMFPGFSSLRCHPTTFDPDRAVLPEGSRITSAKRLQGPLIPDAKTLLAGAGPVGDSLVHNPWC